MITTLLSLLGGGLGGLLRFIPEILKLFTAKADRDHEFRMLDKQLEVDKARSTMQIDFVHAQGQQNELAGQMQAYIEALKGQGKPSGIPWVDAANAFVRPCVTYWWMSLYTFYKVCIVIALWQVEKNLKTFAEQIWTAQDWGIFSMILGFWFVDRVIRKDTGK
jgi:hypothetical protein